MFDGYFKFSKEGVMRSETGEEIGGWAGKRFGEKVGWTPLGRYRDGVTAQPICAACLLVGLDGMLTRSIVCDTKP